MAAIAECNRMSCSKSLSIQSKLALVTPVDSHCVFRESRRFDATKTSSPSTLSSTRASLPYAPGIHQALSTRAPNKGPRLTLELVTDSAKQLRWRELLSRDEAAPAPPPFSVALPFSVVFQRAAPAFVVLVQFLAVRDLQ